MKLPSFVGIFCEVITVPRVEPKKRVKDLDHVPRGRRHFPVYPRYVFHKYPIVGGISLSAVLAENVMKNNALLNRLKSR